MFTLSQFLCCRRYAKLQYKKYTKKFKRQKLFCYEFPENITSFEQKEVKPEIVHQKNKILCAMTQNTMQYNTKANRS